MSGRGSRKIGEKLAERQANMSRQADVCLSLPQVPPVYLGALRLRIFLLPLFSVARQELRPFVVPYQSFAPDTIVLIIYFSADTTADLAGLPFGERESSATSLDISRTSSTLWSGHEFYTA